MKPGSPVAQADLEFSNVGEGLLEPLIFKCWGYRSALPAWGSKCEKGFTGPYHGEARVEAPLYVIQRTDYAWEGTHHWWMSGDLA